MTPVLNATLYVDSPSVREERRKDDKRFSLRQVAERAGIKPTYLSKIERGELPPPSEMTVKRIASELDLDEDVLLAMAGKVSEELRAIICKRPKLFSKLLRELKDVPDGAVLSIVREIKDGEW